MNQRLKHFGIGFAIGAAAFYAGAYCLERYRGRKQHAPEQPSEIKKDPIVRFADKVCDKMKFKAHLSRQKILTAHRDLLTIAQKIEDKQKEEVFGRVHCGVEAIISKSLDQSPYLLLDEIINVTESAAQELISMDPGLTVLSLEDRHVALVSFNSIKRGVEIAYGK